MVWLKMYDPVKPRDMPDMKLQIPTVASSLLTRQEKIKIA
jgi:hypothetical protein